MTDDAANDDTASGDDAAAESPTEDRSMSSETDPTDSEHTKRWNNKAAHDRDYSGEAIDVKDEWVGTTVYLPPSLRDELELGFRQYSYECKRNETMDLKKLRHFYPLVVALGLEQLANTDVEDVGPLLSYVMDEHV